MESRFEKKKLLYQNQELKAQIASLAVARDRYQQLFEDAPIGYAVFTPNGVIRSENAMFRRLTGQKGTLIGKPLAAFIHSDSQDDFCFSMLAVERQGWCDNVELTFQSATADCIVQFSANRYHEDGELLIRGNFMDITTRKAAEKALQHSQEQYRMLVDNIYDVLWIFELETLYFTYVNPSVRSLLGYQPEEMLERPLFDFFTAESAVVIQQLLVSASQSCQEEGNDGRWVAVQELAASHQDGSTIWIEASMRLIKNPATGRFNILGVNRSIRERKLAAQQLQESEARYWDLVDRSAAAMVVIKDGVFLYANPNITVLSGYAPEELIGQFYLDFVYPEDRELVWSNYINRFTDKTAMMSYEFRVLRKDGGVRWVRITAMLIPWQGNLATMCLLADITQRKEMEEEIRHLASHDALTGLPTLRLANDRLAMYLGVARRHCSKVALLFMDLDGFKGINDTFGHQLGNQVLQQTAVRLLDCVRKEDTVCRVGGDEFLVILNDVYSPADATYTAARIRETISAPHSLEGHEAAVGVSIGIALYPDDSEDIAELIRLADEAMYTVKRTSKNGWAFTSQIEEPNQKRP